MPPPEPVCMLCCTQKKERQGSCTPSLTATTMGRNATGGADLPGARAGSPSLSCIPNKHSPNMDWDWQMARSSSPVFGGADGNHKPFEATRSKHAMLPLLGSTKLNGACAAVEGGSKANPGACQHVPEETKNPMGTCLYHSVLAQSKGEKRKRVCWQVAGRRF